MDSRFGSLGLLERKPGDGSRVVVSRFGGQVLSWIANGRERLYLSSTAIADGQQPVRGGVPVCFPQFSGRGPLPKHGFARTAWWEEVPSGAPDTIHLRLADGEDTLRLWPHRFVLDLKVTLQQDSLAIRLEVRNTGPQPWSFTGALHTYLRVQDVAATQLVGLQGLQVEDTLARTFSTAGESPDLSRPIDNVYHGVAGPLDLRSGPDALRIAHDGFPDAVVWNPGEQAAAGIGDIGAGEWKSLLCVEAAQAQAPALLGPGECWQGGQVLRVR